MKKKIAIIGEIGHTTKWEEIIEEELKDYDRVIWLGNIFIASDADINKKHSEKIRENALKKIMYVRKEPQKHVLVIGKDDLSLLFPKDYGPSGACAGLDQSTINGFIGVCRSNLKYIRFFHQEKDTLFSYGGLSKDWFKFILPSLVQAGGAGLTNIENISTVLNNLMWNKEAREIMFMDGQNRTPCGPFWLSWEELKKSGFRKLNQVVSSTKIHKLSLSGDQAKRTSVCNVNSLYALENSKNLTPQILKIIQECAE